MNARDRKRTMRAKISANREQADAGNLWMPRTRMFRSVQNLFNWARATSPQAIIAQKVQALNGRRKCVVFEIGAGYGGALGTMYLDPTIAAIHDKIELHGLDIFKPKEAPGIIWHHGSALTSQFPKSDIIFSQVTAGYVGQFGFLAKKTAQSLHSGGIAVLHVNKYGMPDPRSTSSEPGEVLVQDMGKLNANLKKLKPALEKMGCEIVTRRGAYKDMQYESTDDLVIVIRKK